MKRGPFIVLAGLLSVLLLAAAGVYAYDASRTDRLADGLTVNSVPIGGLTPDQARAKLTRALVVPLQRPVRIMLPDGEAMKLTPRQARLRLDVNAAVDQATHVSRQGSILERTWRDLSGGAIHRHFDVALGYSRSAVRRTVTRIADQIDAPAEDATLMPQGDTLVSSPGSAGVAVERDVLRRAIVRRLVSPDGSDSVRVPVRHVAPDVTEADLSTHYPSYILVDRASFTLRLFKDLKLADTYPIAVGQQGLETPAGLYDIQDKQVDPTWHVPESDWAGDLAGKSIPPGPDNPLKARWMGFNGGAGIHGTAESDSLGSAASHGCIRMDVGDVEQLYDQVTVGTPVYIR